MNGSDKERLRSARDVLLRLHKSLVDRERELHSNIDGPVTSGEFLNLLLTSADLEWLRVFSSLIVEIDEMFAQKDGFSSESVSLHLDSLKKLVGMEGVSEDFSARYQTALQYDSEVAAHHAELKRILSKGELTA
jgi:hypothetical protein